MHLANPPTTLAEAIEQLTERTQQLEAARHDNAMLEAELAIHRESDVEIAAVIEKFKAPAKPRRTWAWRLFS